jgi:SAM-dependent methyltransferase
MRPLRALRAGLRGIRRTFFRARENRRVRDLPRGSRHACWCGGKLTPFEWHASYGVCVSCGTYVNRRPPLVASVTDLYSLSGYWRIRQTSKGFPAIESRAELYRLDGRLAQWLSLIHAYHSEPCELIEVGCAPGVLLVQLAERGYRCLGVEANEDTARWLRSTTGLDIRSGIFPGLDLPRCDLFLALDVVEHSDDPVRFMAEAHRLLRPGGIAIVQAPIDRYDLAPPFGDRCDVFDDVEHLFIFTDRAMHLLAERVGFEVLNTSERVFLAGEIVIFRKPPLFASDREDASR